MGASCGGDIEDELLFESYKAVGLQAQHAYSVLDVRAVGQNRYDYPLFLGVLQVNNHAIFPYATVHVT